MLNDTLSANWCGRLADSREVEARVLVVGIELEGSFEMGRGVPKVPAPGENRVFEDFIEIPFETELGILQTRHLMSNGTICTVSGRPHRDTARP